MNVMMKKPLTILLKLLIVLVLGNALGLLIATGIGYVMPERYVAEKSKALNQAPEKLWEALVNVGDYNKWKPNVTKVEILGQNEAGQPKWREYYRNQKPVTYEVVGSEDKKSLEVSVSETLNTSKSTWLYRIEEHQGKGILQVKQFVTIQLPYSRFASRYIHGHLSEIDRFLMAYNRRVQVLARLDEDIEDF